MNAMSKLNSPITVFREFLLVHFSGKTVQFDDIRKAIREQFPKLCDNTILCTHEYLRRPEWEHQLRHALDYLKNKQRRIGQENQGEYIFPV